MAVAAAQIEAVVSIKGAQQAKQDLADTGKSAEQTKQSFGDMMKQGLANAASFAIFNVGAKAANFLKDQLVDTIQVAIQHQDVMSQTAQVIKSTGDASGMSAQSISDLATSLSKVTPFSDDAIQSGQNLLLTFTGIGKDVFPATTKTMLDMSQAMGMDTKSAAMQLGKALNDPVQGMSALSREGVTFTDKQKEMIKHMVAVGNAAGAQKLMLAELQKEFGGSAEAAGKTFGGQLQILKNNLEDVKQKIGTALLPVLSNLASGIVSNVLPILERFGNWFSNTALPAINGFKNNIGQVFTYVGNVLKTVNLSDFSDAWKTVGDETAYVSRKFGDLFGAASPLGNVLKQVGTDFDPIADVIQRLAQGALNTVSGLLWNISGAFIAVTKQTQSGKGPLAEIGNAFKQVGSILGGQFKTDLAWLGTTFNQIAGWLQSSLMPALATLIPPFMSIATTVVSNLLPAFATLYASGHQIVEAILTPLIGVLERIIPPVIKVAGWLLGGLADGFKFVAPLVKGLADVISNLVNFFTKTELGGDLVKGVLAALAVPVGILAIAFGALGAMAIADFLASIPALVSGFLAGAGAAWTMAIGVIAATWPFLAIGAAIALVVAGIILAVQHWGQIVDWLKGVWGGISSWFSGILNGVKVWFTWLWTTIQADTFKAWQAVQNFLKGALKVVLDIVLGPIFAIANAFIWLYNHNTYFKKLVDTIVDFFKGCFAWLQGAWNDIINWITGEWRGLVAYAIVLWDNISMQVKIGFEKAIMFVESVWKKISDFFINAWNTYIAGPLVALWTNVSTFFANVWNTYIVKPLTAMWQNVSKFFSNIWTNYIAGPIGDLWNQLTNTIGGWAGKAVDWGKNLIQSFVNGIVSMANSVAGAVGGIAGKVLSFLGFHSPTKEGPGQEADQWAPNFVKMYVQGLEAGIPKIQNIVSQLAKPLSVSMSPISNSSLALPSGTSGIPVSVSQAVSSATSSGQPIHIHNYIDGKEITDNSMNRVIRTTRTSGPIRSNV